jgi:hypothetical protein
MEILKLGTVTKSDLRRFIALTEQGIADYEWSVLHNITLTEDEIIQLKFLQTHLFAVQVHLLNEATIWSRAIYPLLLLAEQPKIQVWSQVSLSAQYAHFGLDGVADGVIGRCVADTIEAPYFVVVEAKRGLEGQNPLAQLYGQMLAIAALNFQENQQDAQEVFGCYTIADNWTFMRGLVTQIEAENPALVVESSREYTMKWEAETIAKLLKQIVARVIERRDRI